VKAVVAALLALKGLRPDLFAGAQPTIGSFRAALSTEHVLPPLRELAGKHVGSVPCFVGLGRHVVRGKAERSTVQHGTGTDPPEDGE
jgi:hypothetical protein